MFQCNKLNLTVSMLSMCYLLSVICLLGVILKTILVSIAFLIKFLDPHCSVLVGSKNRFKLV